MGRVKELWIERKGLWPDRIKADYFQWLCGIVGDTYGSHSFSFCLKMLHKLPFYSVCGRDEDRAADGLELREEYAEQSLMMDIYGVDLEKPCSVLEMMIALARRMEDILEGTNRKTVRDYFWMMMYNLTLTDCNDEDWAKYGYERDVRDIVYILLERKYKRNGRGGLFPVTQTYKDQRKIEIWYQMHQYIQGEM